MMTTKLSMSHDTDKRRKSVEKPGGNVDTEYTVVHVTISLVLCLLILAFIIHYIKSLQAIQLFLRQHDRINESVQGKKSKLVFELVGECLYSFFCRNPNFYGCFSGLLLLLFFSYWLNSTFLDALKIATRVNDEAILKLLDIGIPKI
jgi:hypothetical protein